MQCMNSCLRIQSQDEAGTDLGINQSQSKSDLGCLDKSDLGVRYGSDVGNIDVATFGDQHVPTRQTRAQHGIVKPHPRYALAVSPAESVVPRSAKQVLLVPKWRDAMAAEFAALKDNGT